MLQLLSRVGVADNSGVIEARVIKVLTPKNARIGKVGGLVMISSKAQVKNSGILPGTKFKALIIRTKKTNSLFTHRLL